jgi:hypothetical protein
VRYETHGIGRGASASERAPGMPAQPSGAVRSMRAGPRPGPLAGEEFLLDEGDAKGRKRDEPRVAVVLD